MHKSKMTENASKKDTYHEFSELDEYNILIRKMLYEIDLCKSKLENSRHSRIRKGVLSIHDGEIIRFQLTHGHSVLHHIDKSLLVLVLPLIYVALATFVTGNNFDISLATRITLRRTPRVVLLPAVPRLKRRRRRIRRSRN